MRVLGVLIGVVVLLQFGCTKYEVVFDAAPNGNFELPLILKLDGVNCAYDAPSGTLKYTVHPNMITDLHPLVEFQTYSELSFEGQKLINGEVNDLGPLELYHQYELEFRTNGEEHSLHLEFTTIPIAQVITLDEIPNEPKVLGRLLLQHPANDQPALDTYIGIELRGRSSLNLVKRSYGLRTMASKDLENPSPVSFFGENENDRWVLDAQFTDRSRVRSKVTFDIWEQLGHRSLSSNYVELFINNTSMGIYRLGEYYSPAQLEVGPGHVLIKGNDNTSATKFLELPRRSPNGALWEAWEQVYPHPSVQSNWSSFEELARILVEADDTEFATTLPSQLNLDQLIDYYLLMSLCYGYDNAGNNWLFYQQEANSPFEILPWDLNATWGFRQDGAYLPADLLIQNNLFTRLIQTNPDEFRSRLKNRWTSLRQSAFSHVQLMEVVNQNVDQLTSYNAYTTENNVWQLDIEPIVERNYIYNWLVERLSFLDGYFEEMEG